MRKEKLLELKQCIEEFQIQEKLCCEQQAYFLTVQSGKYLLNNGKTIVREKLFKNGRDGSAIIVLPVTVDRNVLLVIEPRVNTVLGVGVGLPAGYIEFGEQPIEAASRELQEETGYGSQEFVPLVSFYQDEGCSSAYNHSFLALGCERMLDQSLDDDEYIRYFECSYDEMLELVEMGYINGANSLLTIEKSKMYMKRR